MTTTKEKQNQKIKTVRKGGYVPYKKGGLHILFAFL